MVIIITTPSLVANDAVGNDVLLQQTLLRQSGYKVAIYAEHCDDFFEEIATSYADIEKLVKDENNTLLYHHSIYWEQGQAIIDSAKCRIFMKYHNITPPEFFSIHDRVRRDATEKGRAQTYQLIASGKFSKYIGDSLYNTNELLDAGAPSEKCITIAPFHRVHDFDRSSINEDLQEDLKDGKVNLLFVGRVVPNKGHSHLIKTLNTYVNFYGSNVRLIVIGFMSPMDEDYFRELETLINENSLSELVTFKNKVSFDDLNTYYKSSDVFLLMSEHEGFCVPILEAQYHNLPIVALARGAVRETLGQNQIVFDEPDYAKFAVAINKIHTDPAIRKALIEAGRLNFNKYEASEILRQTIDALNT